MNSIRTFLIILSVPVLLIFLVITLVLLLFGVILSPFLVIIIAIFLVLVKGKVKGLARQMDTDFRHAIFIWIILSNFSINTLAKWLKVLNRIVIIGKFPWERKGVLTVTNHPAWVDQGAIIQFMLSYFEWLKNPDCFPFIGAARDSIVRLPFLKALEMFHILTPIERYRLDEAALVEQKMIRILSSGGNLIISGPAGRDFRKKSEIIYSPLKKKALRRFGGLCGRLATIEGVTTIPGYIEGTEELFIEVKGEDGKEKEMKFSPRKFFIDFLLLGKFQIKIVFSDNPLILGGWRKEEARKTIEENVLNLADMC